MFQDRRRHARHAVLIKAAARQGEGRFEVICTQIGPAAGFFSCRSQPQVGETLTIEIRTAGRGSPIVEIDGTVARSIAPGSTQPAGFALVWTIARCELGAEPLLRTLLGVLRLTGLTFGDLRGGRVPEFAIANFLNRGDPSVAVGPPADDVHPPAAPTHRSSSAFYRTQGSWSAPVIAPAVRSSRSAVEIVDVTPVAIGQTRQSSGLRPVSTARPTVPGLRPLGSSGTLSRPVEVPAVQAPAHVQPPAPAVAVVPADPPPLRTDAPRSNVFSPFDVEPSQAAGRSAAVEDSRSRDLSQSWPAYALAPGERRMGSRPITLTSSIDVLAPLQLPSSGRYSDVYSSARKSDLPPADAKLQPHRHYGHSDTVLPPRSGSIPISTLTSTTAVNAVPSSGFGRSKPGVSDKRMMMATDLPVTFMRHNQLFAGRLTSLAKQVAIVVTRETPPELDEPILLNMPIEVQGSYRTIYLSGKLLQIATDVPAGKRFVLHIERVDEGKHKGAFEAFLEPPLSSP